MIKQNSDSISISVLLDRTLCNTFTNAKTTQNICFIHKLLFISTQFSINMF